MIDHSCQLPRSVACSVLAVPTVGACEKGGGEGSNGGGGEWFAIQLM